ncbi:unnamed protein product, partial [Symbiodinium necroappetens]
MQQNTEVVGAGELPELPLLADQVLCNNHQCNLIFTDAIQAAPRVEETGGRLIANLYAGCLFLRMAGHFLKLVGSLQVYIKDPSFFKWNQNPSASDLQRGRKFREELSSYLKANLCHNDRQMAASPGVRDWRKIEADIQHCFSHVLNGCGWERGVVVHQCLGPECCRTRQDAEAKTVAAVTQVLFRILPVLPLTSDWTKAGPSLDFFLRTDFHGLLEFLLKKATWAHKLPQRSEDVEADTRVDWRALAGRRYHRFCKVLASPEERFQRTLLAIAIEPLRHLHSRFLKFAHTAIDEQSWPVLLQELWGPSSKYVAVMQYMARLLHGDGTRLMLLAGLSGHESIETWVLDCPSEAAAARWFFLLHALILKLTVAAVERRHATHKSLADPQSPWYCFCAHSLLAEARHQGQAIDRLEQERAARSFQQAVEQGTAAAKAKPGKRSVSAGAVDSSRPKRAKSQSPLEIFRSDWLRQEKERGHFWNPVSKECWSAVRAEFANLSSERLAELKTRAAAGQVISQMARLDAGQQKQKAPVTTAGGSSRPAEATPSPARTMADSLSELMEEVQNAAAVGHGAASVLAGPNSQRYQTPPFSSRLGCQSLQKPLMEEVGTAQVREQFPISPLMVRQRLQAEGFRMHEDVRTFARMSSHIAPETAFPEKVEYPGHCGSLCVSCNSQRTLRYHRKLVDMLHAIVKDFSSNVRLISQTGLILAVETHTQFPPNPGTPRTPDRLQFFAIGSAAGRQAHHPAQVNFAELEFDCGQQKASRPSRRLACVTEDELAARMCFVDEVPAEYTRITQVEWTFAGVRLDSYLLGSLGKTYEVLAEPEQPEHVDANRGNEHVAGDSSDFDILADLAASRPRAAKPKSVLKKSRPVLADATLGQGDGDAAPRAEELQDMEADHRLFSAAPGDADGDLERDVAEDADDGPGHPVHDVNAAASSSSVANAHAQVGNPVEAQPRQLGLEGNPAEIYDDGCWHYRRTSDGSSVGRLHHIASSAGPSLKATCKLHRSCYNMISLPLQGQNRSRFETTSARLGRPPIIEDVEKDLVSWLASGLHQDAQQHEQTAREIRSQLWDVKVRQ